MYELLNNEFSMDCFDEDPVTLTQQASHLRQLSPNLSDLSLTWNNLSVYAKTKKFRVYRNVTVIKQIVFDGVGCIRPGQIVALMGPSGSGKTTLLAALAQRHQRGTIVTGDIKLNGQKVNNRLRDISGFMFQDDFFLKVLTVREHLIFLAKLKMDKNVSNHERIEMVEMLLDTFSLRHVANQRIGGSAQEGEKTILSGGEKRRLSLATAMINNPKILFADEPTTGLDSYNAHRVVTSIKAVSVNTGAPVLCSIHQPIPATLALFDKIILMAEGRLMFAGTPEQAVKFYLNCGFIQKKFTSDAEFIVDCISPVQGSLAQTEIKVKELSNKYFQSSYYKNSIKEIDATERISQKSDLYVNFNKPLWTTKLLILIWRSYIFELRSRDRTWLSVLQKLILAVVSGLCFSNITNTNQDGIQGIQGALFLLVTENTYASMYSVMYTFPKEYPQFMIEYYNDAYSPTAYYIARVVASIPGYILESMSFTVVLYFFAHLRNTFYAFFMTQIFATLCIIISSAFGLLFANIFPNVASAITYMVPVDYFMMLTAGIFIRLGSVNKIFGYSKFISWFYYIYESYTIIQWDGIGSISCETNRADIPCLPNGASVIEHYNFHTENLIRNFFICVFMFIAIHIGSMIIFTIKVRK